MSNLGPNQLFLQGRLQISTARDGLLATGINPDAEQQLSAFLDVHNQLSTEPDEQQDLIIYLQGDHVERAKADIMMSLELAEQSPTFRHVDAAKCLLELLRAK